MNKLECTEQMIYDKEIDLIKCASKHIRAIAFRLSDGYEGIFYNQKLLKTYSDKNTALLHEYYHLEYDAMYSLNDSLQTRKRREYKANKALITKHVPCERLNELIKKGYHKYEIAEEFLLTEEIIDEAIRIYKNMGEL